MYCLINKFIYLINFLYTPIVDIDNSRMLNINFNNLYKINVVLSWIVVFKTNDLDYGMSLFYFLFFFIFTGNFFSYYKYIISHNLKMNINSFWDYTCNIESLNNITNTNTALVIKEHFFILNKPLMLDILNNSTNIINLSKKQLLFNCFIDNTWAFWVQDPCTFEELLKLI